MEPIQITPFFTFLTFFLPASLHSLASFSVLPWCRPFPETRKFLKTLKILKKNLINLILIKNKQTFEMHMV